MLNYPSEKMAALPQYGIGSLSINEAAALICKCLYFEGKIEIKSKQDYSSIFDKGLENALNQHIERFVIQLVDSINNSLLDAELCRRDLDGKIVPEETYIHHQSLDSWLSERNLELGYYYDEYLEFEEYLLKKIEKTIEAERIQKWNPSILGDSTYFDKNDIPILFERIRKLEAKLKKYNKPHGEEPLNTKERSTLLKMIIAMAIKGYSYNPAVGRSPTANEISQDMHALQLSCTDDTIRKMLNAAKDYLPPKNI